MHPNPSKRRFHSAEFKAKVLSECQVPGASVAAVAVSHGLNPNVVRKWLAGCGLKRAGVAPATSAPVRALQFVPVELPRAEPAAVAGSSAKAADDIRLEIVRGALQVKLHCPANAAPSYAAMLRTLADLVAAG